MKVGVEKKRVCPTQRSKKCNVQKQNRTKRRKFVNGKDKRYLIFMVQQQQRQKQQRCESRKSFRLIQPFDPSILMQSNHKCFVSVSQTTYRTSAFILTFFVEKYFITLLMETLFFFHSVLPNETIHLQTLFIFSFLLFVQSYMAEQMFELQSHIAFSANVIRESASYDL